MFETMVSLTLLQSCHNDCASCYEIQELCEHVSVRKSHIIRIEGTTHIAEKPSLARWDSNFDDLITLKTVFEAIMLLDETETHLCKSSYQHCVCDVHAEYTVVGHTLKKHQLLVTKEISP